MSEALTAKPSNMNGEALPATAAVVLGAPIPDQALPPPPAGGVSEQQLAEYGAKPEPKYDMSDSDDSDDEDDELLPPGPVDAEHCTVRVYRTLRRPRPYVSCVLTCLEQGAGPELRCLRP